jgi:hypothetical protein
MAKKEEFFQLTKYCRAYMWVDEDGEGVLDLKGSIIMAPDKWDELKQELKTLVKKYALK